MSLGPRGTTTMSNSLWCDFYLDSILMIMGQSCLFVALLSSFARCGTQATNKNMPSFCCPIINILTNSIKKWMGIFEWLIDWCFYFPRVYYAYHWSEKGDAFGTHTTMLLGTTASVDDVTRHAPNFTGSTNTFEVIKSQASKLCFDRSKVKENN